MVCCCDQAVCIYWTSTVTIQVVGLAWWLSGKESACQCRRRWRREFNPWVGKILPLEEEMATHSSILAWGSPQTEEPGGLQSMGSHSQT